MIIAKLSGRRRQLPNVLCVCVCGGGGGGDGERLGSKDILVHTH